MDHIKIPKKFLRIAAAIEKQLDENVMLLNLSSDYREQYNKHKKYLSEKATTIQTKTKTENK